MEDDDLEYWPEIIGTGHASAASGGEDDEEMPVACIYIPNTDTRSGWGMRMVYRPRNEQQVNQIGFRRR